MLAEVDARGRVLKPILLDIATIRPGLRGGRKRVAYLVIRSSGYVGSVGSGGYGTDNETRRAPTRSGVLCNMLRRVLRPLDATGPPKSEFIFI